MTLSFAAIQLAERLVSKLAVAQRRAALQPDISEIEDLVIQRHVPSPCSGCGKV